MKNKVVIILKIIFSALLIIYILTKIPAEKIFDAIQSANILLIVLAIMLALPTIFLSAYQTKFLTIVQKVKLSFKEIIKIYLTTAFYSVFLPGSISGGVIKWYKFSKFGTKSAAASIVIFNRFLELMVVVILGILYSLPSIIANHQRTLLVIFIIILFFLILGYSVLFNRRITNGLRSLVQKVPLWNFLSKKIKNLLNAMIQFQDLEFKNHITIFGIMISYHLINLYSFFLLASSLKISISIWVLGWTGAVVTVLSILPITIAGLGVREGTLIYLLGFYGVLAQDAVALSFLVLFKIIVISLFGGLLELKEFILKGKYKTLP